MQLTNFILTYFMSKNIFLFRAFLCWTPKDQLRFQQSAALLGLRASLEINQGVLQAEGLLREGVVLDSTCPGTRDLIEYASQIRAFNHRFTWLLLQPESFNNSFMKQLLDSAAILPDSDVVWVSANAVLDIYRVKENQPLATSLLDIDVVTTQQQMAALWKQQATSAAKRKDLGNVYINAAVIISQPQHFKGWNDMRNKQIDTFPKFTYPLLMELSQDLNFRFSDKGIHGIKHARRYNMLQVDDYGVERNGSFNGLAGLLQRRLVEIGITSMFMRGDRLRVLHYSSETVTLRGAFIFRQPSQSAVSNIFLLPFSRGVWLASGVVFLLAGGFVAVFSRRLRQIDPSLTLITPGESVTFTFGAICQQEDQLRFQQSAALLGLRASLEINQGVLQAEGLLREGVVLDSTCPGTRDLIEYASQIRAFNHRFTWLLLQPESFNNSFMKQLLDSAAILPDSDVVWVSANAVLDIYRVKENQPLATSLLDIDVVTTQQQMAALWKQQATSAAKRKDLGNVYINAAVIISQPQHFKGWNDMRNKQIDTFPKFTYPLLMELSQDLNFRFSDKGIHGIKHARRYNMLQVDDYGVERNGSFNGLAGLLQRRLVEIGITSMFMRGDRLRVLHYSSETVTLRGAFIFRQPSQSAVSNIFLLPFSRGVWLASGVVFLLAGGFVAVFSRRLRQIDPSLTLITPGESVTFTFGAICQQGFPITPNLMSIRVAMFITLLTSVFAFTSYSAKIVAILQTPSNAIQTIGDLAQSPMPCGVQETTYKKVYFAESSNLAVQSIYQHKLLPQGDRAYLSVLDGIHKMRTSFFAFQVETSSGYDIISKTFEEQEKCGLKEIEAFNLPMVGVPIRKQSGYRDIIASRLRWQREVGIMGRARRVWLTTKPSCESSGSGFVTVGLVDCLPAILVLGYGALLAGLMLIAEIFLAKIRLRYKR